MGFLVWYFSCATLSGPPFDRGSQAKHVADILEGVQGVHLALAAAAAAHLVAALANLTHTAAHQDLHQTFVAQRLEHNALDSAAAHQIASAERIRKARVNLGQQRPADLRRAPGTYAPHPTPVAQPAAIAVARGYRQVGVPDA